MLAAKFRKALDKTRSIGILSRLHSSITRAAVPGTQQQLERQARRAKRQRRQIRAQQHMLEAQAQRIEAQAKRNKARAKTIKVYERRFERVTRLLSEGDLQRAVWEAGKSYEMYWWRMFLNSNIRHQTEEYKRRFDSDQPLQDWVTENLRAPQGATLSILDVGAGPATNLGKRWKGRTVQITAVDPLADDYNRLLDELGIIPPVRTQEGEVERLTEQFPPNHFDLVTMENALDHSFDPLTGIRQMLEVVKPGGSVVLKHYINEGEQGSYVGFHQWNFCADNGHFMIWNPQTRLSVNDAIGDEAHIAVRLISEVERFFVGRTPVAPEKLLVRLTKI
jgi:SAM-dependent methyltransferase